MTFWIGNVWVTVWLTGPLTRVEEMIQVVGIAKVELTTTEIDPLTVVDVDELLAIIP